MSATCIAASRSTSTLVVVGASVRAVAESAARAGWRVHAVDLFADRDLRDVAASVTVPDRYPEGLSGAAEGFPPGPWLYTGGLENHPGVIAALAARRPLAGCDAESVARVRNPVILAGLARRAGLAMPETRPDPTGLPVDGSWLVKPLASAGGRGIRRWLGPPMAGTAGEAAIWQRHVPGSAWSASYLLTPSGPRLVGTSRQLVGRHWCHAGAFAWCGAVDLPPDTLPPVVRDRLVALGSLLADGGLVGLAGVDLVVDRQGTPHVLEVNPRPTASMELVERATGLPLVPAHLAACGVAPPADRGPCQRIGTWSKAILFAADDVAVDEAMIGAIGRAAGPPSGPWRTLADVPVPPQVIRAGRPVCTLFAHAATPARSLARLHRRVTDVAAVIGRVPVRG